MEPEEIREVIFENFCRCTVFEQIVEAVQMALEEAAELANDSGDPTGVDGCV